MPLHQTAAHDPFTAMIQIKTSDIFEMIISLQGIVDSWKMQDLEEEVKSALGEEFIAETRDLYRKMFSCCVYAELAVDYPDRNDVDGFLDYVESMPANELIYYLLGRWFPRESIPADFDHGTIKKLIDSHEESEEIKQIYPDLAWIEDLGGIRDGLCRAWRKYWNGFFREKAKHAEDRRIRSVYEKRDILEQHGGAELYTQLTGYEELPNPVPADLPITEIELIPLCHTSRKVFVFYGYGSAQVLYDCAMSREHEQEIDHYKARSLIALKALADDNRLKILKLISQNERMLNGKKMAHKLELSPSVVSRHLTQLKDAGLIEEYSADNRNITYSFNISRFRVLGKEIEAFIRD